MEYSSLHVYPSFKSNPQRVINYKRHFDKLNLQGFDFSNGFIASDVKKFDKLNNLSINIFELNFDQDDAQSSIDPNRRFDNKIWKHKLIPLEISEKK